jgi:hypothetical protein
VQENEKREYGDVSTDMWAKFKFEERLQKKLRLGMNCYNIRIV